MKRMLLIILLLFSVSEIVYAAPIVQISEDVQKLIDNVVTRPWPGKSYLERPPIGDEVKFGVSNELQNDPE